MSALPVLRSSVLLVVALSTMACGEPPTVPTTLTRTPQTPAPQTVQPAVVPAAPPAAPAGVPLDAPFVFHSTRDNRDELIIVDREGAELRVLARSASKSDWSRDGRIAFDYRGGPSGVHIIYPDGSGRRFIGPGDYPSWSPDGRFIAVAHNFSIYVLDAQGASPPRLVASAPQAYPLRGSLPGHLTGG